MSAPAPVRAAAAAPPYVWIFLSLIIGLSVLVWHRFGQDPEDANWLDPGQPPINVAMDFSTSIPGGYTAPGAKPFGMRCCKPYPFASLLHDPKSWVGDC